MKSLREFVASVESAGRGVIDFDRLKRPSGLAQTCTRLLKQEGEASTIALAHEILRAYEQLGDADKLAFFKLLVADFSAKGTDIDAAIAAWQAEPTPTRAAALHDAAEAPRQQLIRLLNSAPNGMESLVAMRADLLRFLRDAPELGVVDHDFVHLLRAWFNRGFLQMRRIDWTTPAFILEKLIAYEAVHEIRGWGDLQRRLAEDRRCYGFFHPSLPDEPLIFVQVALVKGLSCSIQEVLEAPQPAPGTEIDADTAIFYSISNCQAGLAGITFGNFLIKQVTESLAVDVPKLKRFSTLSPIPGFLGWLREAWADSAARSALRLTDEETAVVDRVLTDPAWADDTSFAEGARSTLLHMCAYFLVQVKRKKEPRDPVARFHLRNGARLERINWLGDRSVKGMKESAGLLVNYLYDAKSVAANHESYVHDNEVVRSSAVEDLVPRKPRDMRASAAEARNAIDEALDRTIERTRERTAELTHEIGRRLPAKK